MIMKIVVVAITSGLAVQAVRQWIERERTRKEQAAAVSKPLEVQRWEDEGGTPRRAEAT